MTDAYKSYRFGFDKALYAKKFKEALVAHGIDKPAAFHTLLQKAGIKDYDYETVKSYFYPDRRTPPLPVLAALCRALKVSADGIAFSGSVAPDYNAPIGGSFEASLSVEDAFRTVFEPYNRGDAPEDLFEETLRAVEEEVERLAGILARYHYLLEKYRFAALSGRETAEVTDFTERYLLTVDGFFAPWDEVSGRVKSMTGEDFLKTFYESYCIGFYGSACRTLYGEMKPHLPIALGEKLSRLLPPDQRD